MEVLSVVKGTRGGVEHGRWNQVFWVESSTTYCEFLKKYHLFIYLAALGLSCNMQGLVP